MREKEKAALSKLENNLIMCDSIPPPNASLEE